MVLATLLFVCVTGIVRYLGSDIPSMQAAFLRYLIGCFLVIPALLPLLRRPPNGFAMKLFAVRGLVHGAGVFLWFYAMARIPIAEVTAIGYTAPIFVTLGAWFFLGERLYARRIAAVVIGLLGVLIILRPGFQEVQIGAFAQLLAAPLFAASFLLAKRLTGLYRPGAIVAMLSIFCTLALLPGALLEWRDPTWEELAWLTLVAVFATAGHYALTRAFDAAPLTVTQPLGFLQLIWASLLGIFAFGEALDPWVLLGGGIVVGAVTFISHREMKAARRLRTPTSIETKL
ncbi:MAG: DMT family transporter [Rhodospirillales bacterium]